MKAAGNTAGPKQCHQQRALGVALAQSLGQYGGCGQVVRSVVAKGDIIAHEIVDGADAFALRQAQPAALAYQCLNAGMVVVEQWGVSQQVRGGVCRHGVGPG